ncbi:MAG: hypothetical protein EBS16_06620 [Betaproteobacteria bacterium]|nr:hypothetical protein [Betaproteobacteria bacterium]
MQDRTEEFDPGSD